MALADQAARDRALTDHDATLLVEAGAGSGKTALMAGRVVLMLAAGIDPRRIAAITFTELAAGQLSTRIGEYLDELLAGAVPRPLVNVLPRGADAAQRAQLDLARHDLAELTVTTIHGFCQQLVRAYPVETSLDPGARVADPAEAALAWQELLQAFLRERLDATDPVQSDTAIAGLFIARGAPAADAIGDIAEFLRRHRTAQIGGARFDPAALTAFVSAADRFVGWLGEVGVIEDETAQLARDLEVFRDELRAALEATPSAAALVRLACEPIACSALTQKLTWRTWKHKARWEAAAAAHGQSKAEGRRLSDEAEQRYRAVGDAWRALQGMIASVAFGALAGELAEPLVRYAEYKREAALLDFDDLLLQARALLRDHADVRSALGRRFAHVLVDEFQDTDPVQAEILWRLCGEGAAGLAWHQRSLRPGALFCVADPKQAIYRFRGADVDTYVLAREAIRQQNPQAILTITSNFRSCAPILAWVNERFEKPLSLAGQPGFERLSAVRAAPRAVPCVVALDVAVPDEGPKPTQAKLREAEAQAVAAFCRDLVGRYRLQRTKDPLARPGDIALLAPAGTELWRYERALEQRGIPVASQAGKGFFRRQEIHDLIAITRTLADARDTVALGALLRGPLVGLAEEALLDLIAGLPADPASPAPRLTLWTDTDHVPERVAREVLGVLQGLARRARITAPFELLAEAVEALRVRPIVAHRHPGGAERALANVDRYLELARAYEVRGLHAFARDMRAKWETAEAELEGRPDAEEQAVHLITMHSAKGLEWPIVILANTMTGPIGASGPLHERNGDILLGGLGPVKSTDYESALGGEQAQLEREQLRLLYVACTRAEELVVVPRLAAGDAKWLGLVDLDLHALPAARPDGEQVPTAAGPVVENAQAALRFSTEAARIVAATPRLEWRQPSRHDGAVDAAQAISPGERLPIPGDLSPVQGGPVRGSVLHKLVEEILLGDLEREQPAIEDRALVLVTQAGRALAAEPAAGLVPAEIAATVLRTFDIPRVAALRGRLQPEYPIYASVVEQDARETLTHGIADAVVLDGQGNIDLVVDWKSDVQPTEETMLLHREQVRSYLSATGAGYGLVVYMTTGYVDEVARIDW